MGVRSEIGGPASFFFGKMNIHPTAIVHKGAKLADDVTVGPYSVIEEHVEIGKGAVIGSHCVLKGYTTIGENNHFFTGAVIGEIPQDLKYKGEKTFLEIGNNNSFREYVTVNTGTAEGEGKTRIGNDVHIMAYTHIAHDCHVADNVIIANGGTLGGHVEIGEKATLGGLVGIHQFVRVGKLAMVSAFSKSVKDVIPFSLVGGNTTRVYGLNSIGLKRAGIAPEVQGNLKQAFHLLFKGSLSHQEALDEIRKRCGGSDEIREFLSFIESSKRGICTRDRQDAEGVSWSE